ncbi:MAG TPA: peptidoglycan DD-metalloendopeptidase family protein [Xanthobacteraceae bacterium]|nr:peptidoglycan DD-metalloendopeptidase family protein [Xanthobacteraceae bacterium]
MSSSRSEAYHPHAGHSARHHPHHNRPHPVARHAATARDYILGHAGHQVRLGPVAFWIVIGTLVIMAVWTVATGTYFAFREDVLTRLIGRQAEMQFAYEDRVAELRAQIDRLTGRQMLDQEKFEQKLDQLLRRQTALEQRAASMTSIADPAITGSIKAPPRGQPVDLPLTTPKPSPISEKVIFTAPPDREARLESRTPANRGTQVAGKAKGMEAMLARVQASLDRIENSQVAALNSMEESYDAKARRIRGVLNELGLNAGKAPSVLAGSGTGGPFIPVKPRNDAGNFERQLYRINVARAQVDSLNRTLSNVPLRKPLMGEIDTSSGFGVRMDPFIRAPAMHSGLDFRGSMGDPVRATAAGKVTEAGWNGGYGKLVEIDHGNGLSTRYGHLSELNVSVGQTVRIGQTIGRIGSTGRSTGPHLHYETRIDGDAVDPQKFLRAGIRLGSL